MEREIVVLLLGGDGDGGDSGMDDGHAVAVSSASLMYYSSTALVLGVHVSSPM